jgi:hypothetical protein
MLTISFGLASSAMALPNLVFSNSAWCCITRQPLLDILGDDIATKRNHRRVSDDVLMEDGDIGRSTTDINQANTGFFFLIAQHREAGSQRFQDQVFDFQAGAFSRIC